MQQNEDFLPKNVVVMGEIMPRYIANILKVIFVSPDIHEYE